MRAALLMAAAAQAVPSVKLNNGVEMPVISFGAQVWADAVCKQATLDALTAGFRFIWSSTLIGPTCQQAQAAAIAASGIARSDLFIGGTANTASCSGATACYEQTKSDAQSQYQLLNVSTLDMLMLDYPAYGGCDSIRGQWRAFEELYAGGRVRTIGVSNFNAQQLQCILSNKSATVPVANQLQYSIGHGADTVVADNAKLGVIVQAYSPLNGGSLVKDPDCISIGQAHNKSAAQVALRWVYQRNATICTESTKPEYLASDIDIFDFNLTAQEMKILNAKA
eukprot:TRINITY_DN18538_c0_g1_i1.p1 TRINITY_DN18538_c0_g1~~TRINITY_DN18538_c0_g1_i1.p1  ORF type:complete len:300 (+),score=119.81 TRINITY_DN18538_c0_g1_i1:60-902(+)